MMKGENFLMTRFAYQVRDPAGRVSTGEAHAPGILDAVNHLRKVGYEVLGVWPKPLPGPGATLWRFAYRVPPSHLATYTRQLAMYFSSGVPLLQALDSLSSQDFSPALSEASRHLSNSLRAGRGLSSAMLSFPAVFSPVYVRLVHAGESSGALEKILHRLADFLERDSRTQKQLQAALAYPALVFLLSTLIVSGLLVGVFPMFASFFSGLNVEMPAVTRSLVVLTELVRDPWFLLVIAIGGPLLISRGYDFLTATEREHALASWRLRVPLTGGLVHSVALARFARTLSVLTEAGVPYLNALEAAGGSLGNEALGAAVRRASRRVKLEGVSLAGALRDEPLFPPLLTSMLAVGEEVGDIPRVLDSAAATLDLTVETTVSRLTVVLEPLMLGVLGLIVGYILLAVFLPVYRLIEVL